MRFIDPLLWQTLTNSYTSDVTQDSLGYIWIGTRDGLNSYNGYEVKKYKNDPDDSSSLVNNTIHDLFIDKTGRLWIATTVGLCIYNRVKDNFQVLLENDNYPGVVSPYITSVNQDKNSIVYISTENILYRYDENNRSFVKFFEIEGGEISSFVFDNDNNVWIAATQGGGLTFFDRKSGKSVAYKSNLADKNGLSQNDIRDISLYDGKLWIATYGGGVNSLDLKTKKFKRYPSESAYDIYVVDTYVDRGGRLWITDLTCIRLYDKSLDAFYYYYPTDTDESSIKENPVGIFQDVQGNYWTLHSPGGIGLRKVPRGFSLVNTSPVEKWFLSNDNITSIGSDARGNWWMGNHNNGIDIFDLEKGKIINYEHVENDPYSLGAGTIFTIFTDSRSVNWIGSNIGGLQYFNVTDSNFYSYTHDPSNPVSISGNDIRWIDEDSDGNLWVVSHGKGVDKFDRQKNEFRLFDRENSNLSNNWTYQVHIDSEENIWVATSWGLNRMPKGGTEFQNYFSDVRDSTTLSYNEVICIYEDSNNQLWFGSADGLNKYNRQKDNFTRYDNLFKNNFICAIQEDEKGTIWVSTHEGISSLDPSTQKVLNFDQADGLQSGEFNPRSTYKNSEQTIFFGGIMGVNYFNPDHFYYNNTIPKVIISDFKLFNESVNNLKLSSVLSNSISYTAEVKLNYSQNVIGIEFFAANLISPYKNIYKYKLEGFDKNWNEVGTKREATYTNLDPGVYTFHVKASNNDLVWNDIGASLKIVILPPWWMTWWFKLLFIGAIILILVGFYFMRTAQLRNQKTALARMVEERTRSLNETNLLLKQQSDDLNEVNALLEERQQQIEEQAEQLRMQTENLKGKNKELKHLNLTKDKLFSIVAHDLRNPFHGILSLTEMFSSKFGVLTDEDKTKMAGYINKSAKVIYSLLDNLLNWARSQTNEIIFKPVETDIYELISESLKLLETNAEEKDITIDVVKNSDVIVKIDREMINTTIRNLLSNAIKFTPKQGKIAISVEDKVKYAEVAISDTGIGMDEKMLKNLFTIDKKNSRPGTEGERGSALGLVLCKDFIERNGGRIVVESEPYVGSTFKFTLPKSNKNASNKSA